MAYHLIPTRLSNVGGERLNPAKVPPDSSTIEAHLTVDVYRTKAAGTCSLTLTVRDSWGLAATSAFSVPYDRTAGPSKMVSPPLPGLAATVRVR